MPHIPTFERSVTTQPLRLARGSTAVPQGAFGQGSAAALQQVGQLVGQRAIEHLRKDALRQADAAFNSASAQAAAVQTAWQNRIGVNALAGEDATGVSRQGVYEEAVGALAEIGRQHGAELRGPARTLFNTKWVPHAGTVSNAASRYESKNRRAANVETHNASLDAEHRISRQSWDDDTALLQSQDRAMATIATNPFGKSPEALGEDVQAWLVQRNKDVATVMLNVEVNKDPAALADRILSGEFDLTIPEDQQNIWLSRALRREERARSALRTAEEQERKRAERRQRDVEQATAKEASTLFDQGQLTTDWIFDNEARLSPTRYDHYLKLLREEKVSAALSPEAFVDLYVDAGQGVDVRDAAERAFLANQILERQMTLVVNRFEDDQAILSPVKEGERIVLNRMGEDEQLVDRGARDRQQNAITEYNTFVLENPNSSRDVLVAKANELVARHSILNPEEMVQSLPPPLFLVGDRLEPDIDASLAATDLAWVEERVSDKRYRQEITTLGKWARALDRLETFRIERAKAEKERQQ